MKRTLTLTLALILSTASLGLLSADVSASEMMGKSVLIQIMKARASDADSSDDTDDDAIKVPADRSGRAICQQNINRLSEMSWDCNQNAVGGTCPTEVTMYYDQVNNQWVDYFGIYGMTCEIDCDGTVDEDGNCECEILYDRCSSF